MSLIVDTFLAHLPAKRKHTPSGWISFNGPCCDDRRQRGGFIVNAGEAISYHCFNCQFKASWQPGRPVSPKLKTLMKQLHIPDDMITKLSFEALRLKEDGPSKITNLVPTFLPRELPLDSHSLDAWMGIITPEQEESFVKVVEYVVDRGYDPLSKHFFWTPGFENRVILPFTYQDRIVGYTARKITDGNPKYISEQQPGYVFNLDHQPHDRKFVIVTEGPFDAISIGGVALLSADIKAGQHLLINQLQREVILVPDRDQAGLETVEQAIKLGWAVSMPNWAPGIKDVNDAVKFYGKLTTLWIIMNNKLNTELKIRLRLKTWIKI